MRCTIWDLSVLKINKRISCHNNISQLTVIHLIWLSFTQFSISHLGKCWLNQDWLFHLQQDPLRLVMICLFVITISMNHYLSMISCGEMMKRKTVKKMYTVQCTRVVTYVMYCTN